MDIGVEARVKGYAYSYQVLRHTFLPWRTLSAIYTDAAIWMEQNPGYDAHVAIGKATDKLSDRIASVAPMAFRDCFGACAGDDEGIFTLCLAAAIAATGDL